MSGLNELEPWLIPWARWLMAPVGHWVQLSSTRRSYARQQELYQAYLRGESRYPAAPPGTSMHELGRAFDLVGPPHVLAYLGHVWESVGGTWGGRFGDPIHFEA